MSVTLESEHAVASAWLSLSPEGSEVQLVSAACGTCAPCRRGWRDHCRAVDPSRTRVVATWQGSGPPYLARLATVLRAATLIEEMRGAGPRVALLGPAGMVDALLDVPGIAALSPSAAVTRVGREADADEMRRLGDRLRSGEGPSRAPDAIVALEDDLALAARLVRRGGSIGSTVPAPQPVPMPALVQRELWVHQTRDVAATASGSDLVNVVDGWTRVRKVSP